MINEEKLTRLLLHEWKYVLDFLDEAWLIRTQKLYDNR